MRKELFFFSNINSKTETVTEVGYVACGPLRTSDAFCWGRIDFLSAFTARQRTPGSFGPFYPRLTQLILRIVDVSITCQFLIMSAYP